MSIWIKDPLAIFAEDAERGLLVDGAVIRELVPRGAEPRSAVDEVFDASRHVVLPGLVNTHHHFYQSLTRALPQAFRHELFGWLTTLYPIWAGLEPDYVRIATRLVSAELLLSGCTTTTDHHYLFPQGLDEAIDIQVEEARALGIRAVLTRGSMDLSVEDGALPPPQVVQDADVILADAERLIARHHQAGEGAMIQIALAPCSPFTVSKWLMRDTAALADRHDVLLHTHIAETLDEADYCRERFGCTPVDYLEDVGWLGGRTWLAHGIHFSDAEVKRLADAGVAVSSCPHSNMHLASGICRICELEEAGAAVGLGVDGSASNDSSNMIEEVRQAFLVQRLKYGSARVDHTDALRWATAGSAACIRRPDLGLIAPGKAADLALFTLDEPRYSGAHDPLAALVLCGAHSADRVMVAGSWRVEDGKIPGFDLAETMQHHSAAAHALLAKAGL